MGCKRSWLKVHCVIPSTFTYTILSVVLESATCSSIVQLCWNRDRWLYIAGTLESCVALPEAKEHIVHLNALRGAMTQYWFLMKSIWELARGLFSILHHTTVNVLTCTVVMFSLAGYLDYLYSINSFVANSLVCYTSCHCQLLLVALGRCWWPCASHNTWGVTNCFL